MSILKRSVWALSYVYTVGNRTRMRCSNVDVSIQIEEVIRVGLKKRKKTAVICTDKVTPLQEIFSITRTT